MKILKYSIITIIIMFMGILALSNNKSIKDEESYALMENYSFLYNDTDNMDVLIYSSIKNPRFSYITRNKYYFSDLNEDFYIPADVLDISFERSDKGYLFDLKISTPNFTEIYVDTLYLNASNDYSYDRFLIGTLNILSDTYSDDDLALSLAKKASGSYFEGLTVTTRALVTVNEIIASEAYKIEYSQINKSIEINLYSKYYTSKLYLVIKTDKGNIKIDNYLVNNLKLSLKGNEGFFSIMERRDY